MENIEELEILKMLEEANLRDFPYIGIVPR